MIVRTPLRLSLVGGGSDLRYFYEIDGGMSLGMAINYYNYIFFAEAANSTSHIITDRENIETNKLENIKNILVKNILIKFKIKSKKIFIFSDLPYGSGLGSSSAMSVGMLKGISFINNLNYKKKQIAEEAFKLEELTSGSTIGKQDHFMSSFGNINLYKYNKDSSTSIENIKLSKQKLQNLESHLLLIKIGSFRNASEILHDQKNNLIFNENKINNMKKLLTYVAPIKKCLISEDFKELGKLISETWEIKKTFSKLISNKKVNDLYQYVLSLGAYGAKLNGAGSSGYLLVICNQKVKNSIYSKLKNETILNVSINMNGSEILE